MLTKGAVLIRLSDKQITSGLGEKSLSISKSLSKFFCNDRMLTCKRNNERLFLVMNLGIKS